MRVGRAIEYQTLAAGRAFGARGEKGAPAAGLARIRRFLGVVVQPASLAFRRAQSVEIDAERLLILAFVPVPSLDAGSAGEKESR